jgi:hypothetical protein
MKFLTSSLIAILILSAAFASASPQTHKSGTGTHVAKKHRHHGANWIARMFTLPHHHHHKK